MKVFDNVDHCHVAVKVFDKHQMSYRSLKAAYLEEEMMMELKHKNIMAIKDSFEDERFIFLVMNYRINDLRNLVNDMQAALVE